MYTRIWIDQEHNGNLQNVNSGFPFDWPNFAARLNACNFTLEYRKRAFWQCIAENPIRVSLGIVLGLEEHRQKQYIYHLAFVKVFPLAPSFLPIRLSTATSYIRNLTHVYSIETFSPTVCACVWVCASLYCHRHHQTTVVVVVVINATSSKSARFGHFSSEKEPNWKYASLLKLLIWLSL